MRDARDAPTAVTRVAPRRSSTSRITGARRHDGGTGTVVLPLIIWGLIFATLACVGRPEPDAVKSAIAATIVAMAWTLAAVVTGKVGSERVKRIYLPMAVAWSGILALACLTR